MKKSSLWHYRRFFVNVKTLSYSFEILKDAPKNYFAMQKLWNRIVIFLSRASNEELLQNDLLLIQFFFNLVMCKTRFCASLAFATDQVSIL